VRLAYELGGRTPVWSRSALELGRGRPEHGVARVCCASALSSDFTLGVLCGASCGN
jgi:hypothetical protein